MAQPRELAKYKRIIVCCDGTWLASDIGQNEVPTNVAKIARAIAPSGVDQQDAIVKQVVSYHSGLGSGDLPMQKAIFGSFGWGLATDVTQIYEFISNNYEDGDELFFFGFSRGAFTVRSVAGLISNIGILSAVNMSRFHEMWAEYRKNRHDQDFRKSTWYLDNKDLLKLNDVRVKVVGVWDTVGALGVPQWRWVDRLASIGIHVNEQYAFHDTKLSKRIDYAFQALAIDEKRLTFIPTLWHETKDGPAEQLQQCWFPGVHSNVGGQAEAGGDGEAIGVNALAWMVDNCSKMLTFEESAIDIIVEHHRRAVNATQISNGWGCGNIVDNYDGLQGKFFWLLGEKTRTPGGYSRDAGDGSQAPTNEFIHPIARIRRQKVSDWEPKALASYELHEPNDQGQGWRWETKNGRKSVPEYVMKPEKTMSVVSGEPGTWKFATRKSLSRQLCPREILQELDDANRNHETT